MDCKDVEYSIVDFIDNTLSKEQSKLIDAHLSSCSTCKLLYDETIVLMRDFNNEPDIKPSSALRTNFYALLEEEKQFQDDKVVRLNTDSRFNWKTAFQIAASFLLLFIGFSAGNYLSDQKSSEEISQLQLQTDELKENMMLALLDNRSASKRIQAVNYSEDLEQPDQKIMTALIDRMHNDTNINVRLAAAEALAKYSDMELIKMAFIDALTTETDPSLQITIIQILVNIQDERALEPMQKLLDQPDTPDFVKEHANSGILQII